jgi:TRAP-type mannitol/chloroaromatic compound transport system permease large subunit
MFLFAYLPCVGTPSIDKTCPVLGGGRQVLSPLYTSKDMTNNKNFHLVPASIAHSDSYYRERLRQARIAFNVALGATVVSAIVGFLGIILSLGNVSSGVATAVGGATSGAISAGLLRLAKEANDRLDQAARKE